MIGKVLLRVWRGDFRCRLDCKIVDKSNIRPLLGRKACLGMKIIAYLDNNKPITGSSEVCALNSGKSPLTKEQLIQKYPQVFSEGVGRLESEYHIRRLDSQIDPVQHAPRRVPVALRERLRETLEELVQQDILALVTQPTEWISSMVIVPKKDGKLRICLDLKDLNRAIQREHYPLPTIEEIATRLHGARVFTVLDVRHGFWHIPLDEVPSLLTTFNTPFGRYRWPFGISSAPEVFQLEHKVQAIMEMPQPDDVAAIQRLLGLAQCLSKFLPHLSDIKPLRELTQKDTEWTWGPAQQNALETLKKAVSSTPVLRYYNLQVEVTLQCDASQSGLGAAMLQNGQPVAYASRALAPCSRNPICSN